MNHFFKLLSTVALALVVVSCSQKEQTGKATLSGKFTGAFPDGKVYELKVSVPNMIFENVHQQFLDYETRVESDGTFSLSVPLYSPVYAMLSINDNECGMILLSSDQETKIELFLDENNDIKFKMLKGEMLTSEDFEKINQLSSGLYYAIMDPATTLSGLRYDMTPDEYKNYLLQWTENQIALIEKNQDASKKLKKITVDNIKWATFTAYLFNYRDILQWLYENQSSEKDTVFTPASIDKSYYSFLGFFDFNNPPTLVGVHYSGMCQAILNDSILNIPDIENMALADWLKATKSIMADLIGADEGIFYDFLTLYAYSKQLDATHPKQLSDKQIEEIKTYFKNPTFAKYLFEKNEELKQSNLPVVINETPDYPKNQFIETIVSKYKGKLVVIDLWATWCSPCMMAIADMRPLKAEMKNKDVVWVYITSTSSPKDIWREKIERIGGEHYYITADEWQSFSVSGKYETEYIPTYLIFDAEGNFVKKFISYPGKEEIREVIERSL